MFIRHCYSRLAHGLNDERFCISTVYIIRMSFSASNNLHDGSPACVYMCVHRLRTHGTGLETSNFLRFTERGKMWSALHQLRNSATYKTLLSNFLKSQEEADPIFYQYVGDHMVKDLVKKRYVIHEREPLPSDESLSYEEKNALRYTAG